MKGLTVLVVTVSIIANIHACYRAYQWGKARGRYEVLRKTIEDFEKEAKMNEG